MSSKFAPPQFTPQAQFAAQAHISSEAIAENFRETARQQREAFWKELSKVLRFEEPFKKVLDWKMPVAKWFEGGRINVSVNCLDRHLSTRANKTAILWEGEPIGPGHQPEIRQVSYKELHAMTCQIANGLKSMGVKVGDRVAIYMPMVPETVASMLACARLGAIHTVIFGGFASHSIFDRLQDSQAKVIITATGTWRKGQFLKLKPIVDEALSMGKHEVEHVLVYDRVQSGHLLDKSAHGLERSWQEYVEAQPKDCPAVPLDTEEPLFILYTSGTTGKPKGLYHTQAGYLLGAHWTTRWLFDLKEEDIYWCTADCGWITGHTYVTYGPLSNGATVFMYEGAPTTPGPDRFWDMIERHRISILYTAPTAIRSFMRLGDEHIQKHDLTSLRVLGSVGEPINPEAWLWYYRVIGGERCPVVDTWWQTETGASMIAPFPGATTLKPGSATKPLPGIEADVVDPETGASKNPGERGALVIREPWPSMARGVWGDPERFEKTYWNTKPALKGIYFTSDYAVKDEDGDFWIEGRMDDVLNVSGHRIGSAEVESALVSHPDIAEAAAVGMPDPVKGQAIAAFITIKDSAQRMIETGAKSLDQLKLEARNHVGSQLGAHAKPDQVRIARALPKTRSGKIMRRLLRELAATGKITGDTSTLEDFSAQTSIDED